jgi:hypothetical protein
MSIRALIYGMCLVTAGATNGTALAQAPAPGPNSAPVDHPTIDPTAKTPNTTTRPIPEVVKPTSQHGDVIQPRTPEDPAAVLHPPNVDPKMTVEHPAAPAHDNGESAK